MKSVGRPPQIDKNGEHIVRTTINISVPVKLLEFLKREGIKRSELFTSVVTQMHEDKICPKCYTLDVFKSGMGIRCNGACSRYQPYFYKRNKCPQCKCEFASPGNLPILTSTGGDERLICESCHKEWDNVNSK
jgi:hypothetical protein